MKRPPTNYATAAARIRRCDTPDDCARMERSLDRLYRADVLTDGEFRRLDGLLFDRVARITPNGPNE